MVVFMKIIMVAAVISVSVLLTPLTSIFESYVFHYIALCNEFCMSDWIRVLCDGDGDGDGMAYGSWDYDVIKMSSQQHPRCGPNTIHISWTYCLKIACLLWILIIDDSLARKQNEYIMKAFPMWNYGQLCQILPMTYDFAKITAASGASADAAAAALQCELMKRTTGAGAGEEFVCDDCGKCYNRKGNLGRHKRYECGKDKQFRCAACPKSFFRKDKLCFHMKMCHNVWEKL